MTEHEKNLQTMREREMLEAAIPEKVTAMMQEINREMARRFATYQLDSLVEMTDWLQFYLRERFPDHTDVRPRIRAMVDEQNRSRIRFQGLREFLTSVITEQDLGAFTMRRL